MAPARIAGALVLAFAVATCRDTPTGPAERVGHVALGALTLPYSSAQLAQFGLSVDSIRLLAIRPPSDTAARKTVAFAADADQVSIDFPIPLQDQQETLQLIIELRGGGFVLFTYSSTVTVTAGPADPGDAIDVAQLTYTGPGATITSLVVTPLDSVVRLGDSLRFKVDALAGQTPVTLFYVSWSTTNETLAPINAHGVLRAPNARGNVTVTATTPTGINGSTVVTFVPVPTAITAISPLPPIPPVAPGGALGPLRVKVMALDGLGVKGIPVQFQATSGGGSVANAVVVTDDSGYAQTGATAGTTPGAGGFTASVSGIATAAQFNYTILNTGATQLAYLSPPGGGFAGTSLPPIIVALQNAQGQTVPTASDQVTIALGANPGGATLTGTTTQTAAEGLVVFSDLVINNPGTGYTLVASATGLTSATSPPFDVILGVTGKLWTNAAGGNWSNPANWSGGVVPGPTDTVFVTLDGTYTVTLDVNATVAYLFVGGGSGTQTVVANGRTFGVDSAAIFNPQTILDLTNSTVNLTAGTGTLTSTGTIAVRPGTSRINGVLFVNSGGVLNVDGNNGTAVLQTDGDVLNVGTIELTGTSWGGQLSVTTGSLVNGVGGQLHVIGGAGNGVTGSLDNQGTVQVDGPWTLSGTDAQHFNSGTIAVLGGDWTLTQTGTTPSFTTAGTVTVGAGRTWAVNGGSVDYANPTPGGIGGGGTISLTAVTLSLTPDLTEDTLSLVLNATTVDGPGTLRVASGATLDVTNSTLNAPLINSGTIEVLPGSTAFNGGFSNEALAMLRLLGNNGNANLSVATGFGNQGTVELTGTSWGGNLAVPGGSLIITTAAQLHVAGGAGNSLTGTLTNGGTVLIDGPFTLAGAGADHTSSGTIQVSGADWTLDQTGTTPSFITTGNIQVASGRTWTVNGGAVTYQSGSIAGKGLVSLNSATLGLGVSFTHDTLALNLNASTVNGPGSLTVAGATTLSITSSIVNADLINQGTVQNNPGSSAFNGAVANQSGALLRLIGNNGTSGLTVANGFTNAGTIELTGTSWGGSLAVTTGALVNGPSALFRVLGGAGNTLTGALDNQGTVQVDGPWTLGGAGAAHLNSGTIAVTGADWILNQTGTTPSFTTTGTVTIGATRTWIVNGGAVNYQPGGAIAGKGAIALSGVTLGLGIGLTHDTLTLSLTSTTVNGPGTLTVAGTAILSITNSVVNAPLVNQGQIQSNPGTNAFNGPFSNQTGTLLRLLGNNGSANVSFANGFTNLGAIELTGTSWGGVLTVSGTLVNAPTGLVHVINGAGNSLTGTLDNQGSIQLDGPWALAGAGAQHTNSGSIVVSAADWTLTQTGSAPSFTTTGIVTIGAGRTWNVNGGTLTYQVGSLGGRGQLALNGVTLGLGVSLTHDTLVVSIANSTVNGTGTLTAAGLVPLQLTNVTIGTSLTNQGTIQVNPGTNAFTGAFANQPGAVLRLLGNNGNATLAVAGFTNQGTIELTGTSWGGALSVTSGTLANGPGGTLRIVNGAGNSYTGTLNNQGLVQVDGPWTLAGAGAQHTNSGTITLGGGDWTLSQSGPTPSFTNNGTISAGAGRTLTVTSGSFINAATGTLSGTGTVNVAATTFNQNGSVNPGGSPGTLSITGNLPASATSVLNVELGGTLTTQYDRVVVSGNATTDGTLNVTLVNGFTPLLGDAFTIVQAASRSGTFAAINLPSVAGLTWLPTLNGTSVQLELVSASALAPVEWINGGSGNWSGPGNWSTGVVPGPGDSVIIGSVAHPGTFTVTVDVAVTVGFLDLGGPIGAGTQTLAIASPTLTLNAGGLVTQTGVLSIAGGALAGGGIIVDSGTVNWSAGQLVGAGVLQVAAGGVLNMPTTGLKTLNAKTIQNAGTIVWADGNVSSGVGAAVVNQSGGLIDAQGNASLLYNLGGAQPRVTNQAGATFRRSTGAGAIGIEVPFDNAGAVDVQTGTLTLRAGGTFTNDVNLAAGTFLFLNVGSPVFATGADITGAGTTRIAGATPSFDAADTTQIGKLYLETGSLLGAGAVAITDSLVWSGGTMLGTGGVGVTHIPAGADLLIAGTVTLNGRTIVNDGTAVWSGTGNISTGNGAQFVNRSGALLDLQANASWSYNLGGAVPHVVNQPGAQLRRSVGTGTTDIRAALDNDGTVDVQTGTLSLGGGGTSNGAFTVALPATLLWNGGTMALGASSSLTGAGTMSFGGGLTTIAGVYDVTGTTSVGGGTAAFSATDTSRVTTLALSSGTLGGTGVVLVRSSGAWSGGTLADAGVLRVPAGVTLSITSAVTLNGHTIANAGQVLWTAGNISSGNGAVVANTGLFDARADAFLNYNLGGTAPVFSNTGVGTLRRSTGLGTATFNVAVTNAGLVEVQTGVLQLNSGAVTTGTQNTAAPATLLYGAGAHSWATGAAFTGAGRVVIDGPVTVNVDAASTDTVDASWIELASGTLGGLGVLRMKDSLVWTGGSLTDAGVLQIPAGARLAIRGGGTRSLSSHLIANAGVVSWTDATTISSGSDASLRIESGGVFQLEADANWNYNLGGAVPHIDNLAGGLIKRGVATSAISVGALLNNDGTLDLQTGTVTFLNGGASKGSFLLSTGAALGFGGGTETLDVGSAVSGPGSFLVSAGTVTVAGDYNVTGTTRIAGGTLAFNGSKPADITTLDVSAGSLDGIGVVNLHGAGTWSGGAFTGTGTLAVFSNGGSLTVPGTAGVTFTNRTIANAGTIVWKGTGAINSGQGAVLNNQSGATLDIQGGGAWVFNQGGTTPTLNNLAGGVVKRTTGLDTATVGAVVNNSATVDVSSGVLRLTGGGASSGTFLVSAATGTLEFGGGVHVLGTAARINGAGSVFFTAGTDSIKGTTAGAYDVTGVTQIVGSANVVFNTSDTTRFSTFQLRGGTATGSANMVVRGSGLWTGGTLGAPGALPGAVHLRIPVNVTFTISGTAARQLDRRTLLNFGTVNWTSGSVTSLNNAVFDNQPSANFILAAAGSQWSGSTGGGTMVNRARGNVLVTAPGSVTVGTLVAINNLGTLDIAAGATLKATGPSFTNGTGSDLQGNGTLDVASIVPTQLFNTGTVRPGTSPGILTINAPTTGGGWPQGPGSTLVVEIFGPTPITGYDRLVVNGQITSGGAIQLVGNGTYQPRTISLQIMTFSSRVGQTFGVSLLNLTGLLGINYSLTDLQMAF